MQVNIIRGAVEIILQNAGEAYFVGGCVRDYFLTRPQDKNLEDFVNYLCKNNKDVDIATNLHPEVINKIFTENGFFAKTTIVTNVVVKSKTKLEITTLRMDINPNGRWTQTQFATTIEEDAQRRDFTINAIYLQPNFATNTYIIHDFYNGLADLQNKQVKFIGDATQRIREDYLRMLRFFRFSCRFSTTFNENGLNACINLSQSYKNACMPNQDGIILLAKERVRDEIFKILSHHNYPMFLHCFAKAALCESLCETFFGIAPSQFAAKTEQILHYNLQNPFFIFLSLAGTQQNIILLTKREQALLSIINTELKLAFTNAVEGNLLIRLSAVYAGHNQANSQNLTKAELLEAVFCYFVVNNIQPFTKHLILDIINT